MIKRAYLVAVLVLIAGVIDGWANLPTDESQDSKLVLREGWTIQSSAKVQEKGEVLSTTQYKPSGWFHAAVPTTVVNALIKDGVYPDPYYGMNFRSIPGTAYEMNDRFALFPMPPDSPFRVSWWYRTEFRTSAKYEGKNVWLHFEGINYRANIWLNGRRVADSSKVVGAFRSFEFSITDYVLSGGRNVLAVEVFPPQAYDLSINWADINPTPPDKNMGLWHEVFITTSGPVTLRYPQVVSHLDLPSLETAHLTVNGDLHNASGRAVNGVLTGQIENIQFQQDVEIGPNEWKRVSFTPDRFPQLNISHPRVWWPWQMGEQNRYKLEVQFVSGDGVSDRGEVPFGIREVTSELTPEGHRVFKVNGRRILIRGAMWWGDALLRSSAERQEAEIRYARGMNLNGLRMDGHFEDENFLDLTDQYGLLVMAGFMCCDHWERWQDWKEENYLVAGESQRSLIRSFRNHPSLLAWLNGDDNPPPANVERMYMNTLQEENWPNPALSSATGKPAELEGKTGFKMTGPYDNVPPSYWLIDQSNGGAFGFLTETSLGGAVPPFESLRDFIPQKHLWPLNENWDYHAGAGGALVQNLKASTKALSTRYGAPTSAQDYAWKSQVMNYDGMRALFEAYGRNKYLATGVVHENLNQAWPSTIYQLYDYYLRPGGGYFGTKKACEPLHIQYSYDDQSIIVVNSLYRNFNNMKVTAKVYNLDLNEKFSKEASLDIPADSSNRVFTIPGLDGLTKTYFVWLKLEEPDGRAVSRNFYWLSTSPDIYEWDKTTWFYTPTRSSADLTALQLLPKVPLTVTQETELRGEEKRTRVKLVNPASHLAFFVHLRITKGHGGEEVLPIAWEDNYIALMPGERREIEATYSARDVSGATPVVEVDGWNVVQDSIE